MKKITDYLTESKRSKADYEEWLSTMTSLYSKINYLVDAVWNQFYADAARDGYHNFLENDEDNVCDIIETLIREAK